MINSMQIKKIHALKNQLKWDEEQYRGFLMEQGDGFARSCKDLSEAEAARLIKMMETEAVKGGVWNLPRGDKTKYSGMDGRQGMASAKQLRYIDGLWAEVSYAMNHGQRAAALGWFLHRITGVQKMEFVTSAQAHKVLAALQKMKDKKEERKCGSSNG